MEHLFIILIAIGFSCSTPQSEEENKNEEIELVSPAGANSEEATFFTTQVGDMGLCWLEKKDKEATLKFSVYKNGTWTTPKELVSGIDILTNWADFPGIVTNGSNWVAWYLQMTNPETFAYDVMIKQSSDNGKSWTEPQKLHSDSTQTEHGFVSAVPINGGFQLIWLDGRFATDMTGNFTLRTAYLDFDGAISNRAILDYNTCTCCQTSLINVDNDYMALYRDRTDDEIRDIATVSYNSSDTVHIVEMLNNDNWHIAGCPVNGPRAISNGDKIGVVWFTMGTDEVAKVQFVSSNNGGKSYTSPLLIDANNLGRVDILASGDSYYISYLDEAKDGSDIKIAKVQEGKIVDITIIANVSSSRKTGFPRMALAEHDAGIFITYTDVESDKVELKYLPF